MRDLRVRLLVVLLAALSLAAPALAQEPGDPANETAPNATSTDEPATTDANDAATDDTTSGDAPEVIAAPTTPPDITIVLEGTDADGFSFIDAAGKKNPTITVLPGQKVTFLFKSVAGGHNLALASGEKTDIIGAGREAELVWTAPGSGSIEYWCDPHKSMGMRGTIRVSAPASGGDGKAEEISGPTIDLGQRDPACAGQVAPAIVTTGVTGGPTLADYIAKCKTVEGGSGPERAAHVVDYVIPLSWALIGLGIVGVVWVHKYYKP